MNKACLIFCLVFSVLCSAQIVNFPDANFKAKLLQPNVAFDTAGAALLLDVNNNGEIEISETANVERLIVSNANISDLSGISYFTDLKFLNCNNNALTTITIDNSISLMALSASHNMISSIAVNFESTNEGLDLSYNNLTSFVAADTYFAEVFNLSHNQLTSLTLNNSIFAYFYIDYNNLSSIQFIGNILFAWPFASFTNNQFTQLDFPANVQFVNECTIFLGGNTVDRVYFHNLNQPGNIAYSAATNTVFDLGNFSMTKDCDPENQGNVTISSSPNLQEVIFKNGFNHNYITCDEGGDVFQNPAMYLQITNCPSLNHLCVDQGEIPAIQERLTQLGLQNQVAIDSNCVSSVILATETVTAAQQFILSPVPAQNILQIHSNDHLEIRTIEIYNNLGQLVQKEIENQQTLDVSRLSKGSYYLRIYTDNLIFVKPFLKD